MKSLLRFRIDKNINKEIEKLFEFKIDPVEDDWTEVFYSTDFIAEQDMEINFKFLEMDHFFPSWGYVKYTVEDKTVELKLDVEMMVNGLYIIKLAAGMKIDIEVAIFSKKTLLAKKILNNFNSYLINNFNSFLNIMNDLDCD